MDMTRHNTLVEGTVTGALGASAVASWFLLIDTLAGHAFFTPMALGAAMFGGTVPPPGSVDVGLVAAYTAFHYGAFVLVGLIAAVSTHLATRQPAMMALFTVLFVMFEMGFYGLVAVLDASLLLGPLAWYQIGIGNLLAATAMGGFLLATHPQIRLNLSHALSR